MRLRERFVRRIAARFFVRFHMGLIFASSDSGRDLSNTWSGGGGGSGGSGSDPGAGFRGGGGHFGGGGASGSFDASAGETPVTGATGGGSSGSSGSGSSLDLDDGWLIVAVLALVLCVAGVQRPAGLPPRPRGPSRRRARVGAGVLIILAAAVFVGRAAYHACPPARRLADVVRLCQ